jgi:hypothetical protein
LTPGLSIADGDIVKSKKSVGWRTMLVVPELEVELSMQEHSKVRERKRAKVCMSERENVCMYV